MLEWEEHTFLGIKALYERLVTRPQERAAAEVRVHLDPHRQRLFLLAQMAAKGGVTLFETEENALCDDRRIFLPPSFDLARTREANLAFLEIKTLLAGLAIRNAWPDDTVLVERLPEVGETFPGFQR